VYRKHGVREYIVWRVLEHAIDWFVLNEGRFTPLPLTPEGLYKSRVFPGLWLDPGAMIRLDGRAMLDTLYQGLKTAEHAEFVTRLNRQV
jgi:hypothetical protein